MSENMKGLIIWAIFLTVCAVMLIVARRMRKRIDEEGIKASASFPA